MSTELSSDNELEDLEDQVKEVGKLTPREYARLRDIAPQLVYYYIRNKVIELEYCVCGRRVIDVKTTDEILSETSRVHLRGVHRDTSDKP